MLGEGAENRVGAGVERPRATVSESGAEQRYPGSPAEKWHFPGSVRMDWLCPGSYLVADAADSQGLAESRCAWGG